MTSGSHGLRAEECLNESAKAGIELPARALWIGAALVHAVLSVSGQLGEIIEWTQAGEQDQAPEDIAPRAEPDGRLAEFAVMCNLGDCVLLPGHEGQCIPPAAAAPVTGPMTAVTHA